jgi:hypothetical protein
MEGPIARPNMATIATQARDRKRRRIAVTGSL